MASGQHRPGAPETLTAAGTAYAAGGLSVDEVAATLALSIPDAVALLQKRGYCRSVACLRLTSEERQGRLALIRRERCARGGAAVARPDLVRREVIASQRLADVDARPWLDP